MPAELILHPIFEIFITAQIMETRIIAIFSVVIRGDASIIRTESEFTAQPTEKLPLNFIDAFFEIFASIFVATQYGSEEINFLQIFFSRGTGNEPVGIGKCP